MLFFGRVRKHLIESHNILRAFNRIKVERLFAFVGESETEITAYK